MTTRRRRAERRLLDAVLLVLASSGCDQGKRPDTRHDAAIVAISRDAAVPLVDAEVAVVVDAAVMLPGPSQKELDRLCAHRKREHVDVSAAKPASAQVQGLLTYGFWDGLHGVVICDIVRGRIKSETVTVMHTPRCCRKGMPPDEPCPGASPIEVPGTTAIVERARLDTTGKVVSSDVQWQILSANGPEEPYCGRRPEGLRIDGEACRDAADIGAQLARMAELELASVPAFERLARELALHGAPPELVERAHRARRDEVRHAAMMTSLAARYGAAPRRIEVHDVAARSLVEIARENAIEGCVREAYGALVATYQAEKAAPGLRRAFRAIARDERRHAALAEDVDHWISSVQDIDTDAAYAAAMQELRASLATSAAVPELGIPGGADAVALFDAYFQASV